MSAVAIAIIGFFVGVLVIGVVIFCYLLVTKIKILAANIDRLVTALAPILENADLGKALQVLRGLGELANGIGQKMDSLNATFQVFCNAVLARPAGPAAAGVESSSGVYGYNEEEAASRDNAARLRRAGVETEEGRVYVPAPEEPAESPEPPF